MNNANSSRKLPPFGKLLAARLEYGNPPFLVFVTAGLNAWERAKKRNQFEDYAAVVFPGGDPYAFRWPVQGATVIVEWDTGPSEKTLERLLGCLITEGCERLASWYVGTREEAADYFDQKTGIWVDGFCAVQIYPTADPREAFNEQNAA